jgi:hypothetical protein
MEVCIFVVDIESFGNLEVDEIAHNTLIHYYGSSSMYTTTIYFPRARVTRLCDFSLIVQLWACFQKLQE